MLRLGLERSDSARDAVGIISKLVDDHGLFTGDGADPAKPVDVGFLVCDQTEAWVIEVSGRHWVAERVTSMKQVSSRLIKCCPPHVV